MENFNYRDYRQKLTGELLSRQEKRPGYSLRSFARHLAISPATLSQVISGKRDLSQKSFKKVATRLGFSPLEYERGLKQISKSAMITSDEAFCTLEDDFFRYMSDWHYFAILSLASAGHAPSDPKKLAARFGISTAAASDSISRLIRLGLLQSRDGNLINLGRPLRTKSDVPSAAARNLQHQHLKLAAESLESDPIERRDMTSITMATHPHRIPKAKEMIKQFRRKLCRHLEVDGKGAEVFVFALQLFPLTKVRTE